MRNIWPVIALTLILAPAVQAQEAEDTAPSVEVAEPKQSPAELRADSLDRLFASLRREARSGDAKRIEQKIWDLWNASDSPTAEVLLRQASKAMDEGAPEESLKILDRLIGAHPDFPEAWNRRATLYFLMKDYEKSLADIDKVLELEPRHFGALSGKGMILQRQKKYSQAIEAYGEALSMNPAMEGPKDALKELERLERGI